MERDRNIINAPFIIQMRKICNLMYQKGWNEKNAGNVSLILKQDDIKRYLKLETEERKFKLESPIPSLANMYFLITGSGKYLRNIFEHPEENLGIIKISNDGTSYNILWGLIDAKPTSEIMTHLLCHKVRLEKDPKHSVIIHNHTTNIEAMTFVVDLTDKDFTRALWKMQTESIVVFPEGVGVLPWLVCGSELIGKETAKKMEKYRLVIWAHHGIVGAGRNLDEVFGLIETAEKAAEIYIKIANIKIKQTISDKELKMLAKNFNIDYNKNFIEWDD